ncbi:MAG TPA: DUF3267 domain-containing protein [Bacillales bacterium]
MNCLKSVRFMRDYGTIRIAIFSVFATMVYFTLFYVLFLNLHPQLQINRFSFPILLAALILIYPLHKLFHCFPIWLVGRKASLSLEWQSNRFPILFCDPSGPISRNLSIVCVAFPGVAITVLSLMVAPMIPLFFHYIAVASSINFGLAVTDFIYLSYLIKAPSHAYVEDFREGFHILVQTFKH